MKKTYIAASALLCVSPLMAQDAQEINSNVIHDYTYVAAGYSYMQDVFGSDFDANGGVAQFSYDIKNIVLGVSGSYSWVDVDEFDADVNFWGVGGSIGYVFRPMKNHLNIIPRFGVAYNQLEVNDDSENFTTIEPGITLSYAFNNRFSVNGGYTFGYDVDNEEEAHIFTVGADVAITQCIGLIVSAAFTDEDGFRGIFAGAGWHF